MLLGFSSRLKTKSPSAYTTIIFDRIIRNCRTLTDFVKLWVYQSYWKNNRMRHWNIRLWHSNSPPSISSFNSSCLYIFYTPKPINESSKQSYWKLLFFVYILFYSGAFYVCFDLCPPSNIFVCKQKQQYVHHCVMILF